MLTIGCVDRKLLVTLPTIAAIGSEERLSFGGGGEIATLVVTRLAGAPSVSGEGAAPDGQRLAAMLAAGPGASYGAAALGPLVPVPDELATGFVARCTR